MLHFASIVFFLAVGAIAVGGIVMSFRRAAPRLRAMYGPNWLAIGATWTFLVAVALSLILWP